MAWKTRWSGGSVGTTKWATGNVPSATHFNDIGDDIRTFGGNVDAAGYRLVNCAGVDLLSGTQPSLLSEDFDFLSLTQGVAVSSPVEFAVSSSGGTMTAAAPVTVTIAPVPPGLNGADAGHYLHISGGTGAAETVLITGGTAVAGGATGTIVFTPANNHSGAWKIGSATGGIWEAKVACGGVGTIILPRASITCYPTLVLPTTISLIGQLGSTTDGTTGSVINCLSSPGLVIADGNWGVTSQGMAVHANYTLYGPGTGYGMWIGGDPASVFAPSAWEGSYTRTYNLNVRNFATALTLRHGNFLSFVNSAFSGYTTGLYIPSDANGEFQPVDFVNCLIGAYTTGNAVVMNNNGFAGARIHVSGGQIVGPITGAELGWDSQGTHYESNVANIPILNITAAATHRVYITGGTASVHGTALASAFVMTGAGSNYLHLKDIWFQADVGMTVTNLVAYGPASGFPLVGSLAVANIDIAAAGVVTNLLSITSSTIQASRVCITQPVRNTDTNIAAGATVTFPKDNYPVMQCWNITGATIGGSGVTAVAGLLPGVSGQLRTINAQTFTASATIGNTVTTTAGLPYQFYFDGTQIWIR